MDVNAFLFEATRCLCSSLNARESLEKFYSFICREVPVHEFRLSSTQPPFTYSMRVATVTAESTSCDFTILPVSDEQKQFGDKLGANDPDKFRVRMVLEEDDDLFRYLRMFRGSTLRPPFLFLRLVRDGRIIGSAMFLADVPFCEGQLALLRELEAPLCIALSNLLQFHEVKQLKEQLVKDNERLRRKLSGLMEVDVVGAGGGLREVMKKAAMAAPVDVPVLITGETGSGKEIIAKAMHDMSSRRGQPFVAVNCGALPPSLVDSELFGHARGAFTGASSAHKGWFERADGGTLFLDEVGELPAEAQARLLRVLETREVERVGGSSPIRVNIRLIAATNRNLAAMVKEGTFREDLYYRLRVVSIHMPPLRERRQDIPSLTSFLLRRSATRYGMTPPPLAPGEMERLLAYDWPGNVRELQNVLEEALVCSGGQLLRVSLGGTRLEAESAGKSVPPALDSVVRDYLLRCLSLSRGRVEGPKGAARLAGLTPSTFRFRCRKLGIVPRQVE